MGNTRDFAGPFIVHCHNLGHLDKGMLAVELVKGQSCHCELQSHSHSPEFMSASEVGLTDDGGWLQSREVLTASVAIFGALSALGAWLLRASGSSSEYAVLDT